MSLNLKTKRRPPRPSYQLGNKMHQLVFGKNQYIKKLCPICGKDWHDDTEECGNEV